MRTKYCLFHDGNGLMKSTWHWWFPSFLHGIVPMEVQCWSVHLVDWALNSDYSQTNLDECRSTLLSTHIISIPTVMTTLSLSHCESTEWLRKRVTAVRRGHLVHRGIKLLLCWVSFWWVFIWDLNIFLLCAHLEKSVHVIHSHACHQFSNSVPSNSLPSLPSH